MWAGRATLALLAARPCYGCPRAVGPRIRRRHHKRAAGLAAAARDGSGRTGARSYRRARSCRCSRRRRSTRRKTYYVFFEQADRRELHARAAPAAWRRWSEAGVAQVTLVIDSPAGRVEPMLVAYSFIRSLPMTDRTPTRRASSQSAATVVVPGRGRPVGRPRRAFPVPPQADRRWPGTLNEQQMQRAGHRCGSNVEGGRWTQIYQDRTKLSDDQVTSSSASSEVIFTAEQARAGRHRRHGRRPEDPGWRHCADAVPGLRR